MSERKNERTKESMINRDSGPRAAPDTLSSEGTRESKEE